ncbi:MAG: sugar phosphate isomerase/epimerase [Isosphaeraceae bacterium]
MIRISRRRFLNRVPRAAAAVLPAVAFRVSPRARAGARRWTMRLSASSIAFAGLPVERACERIARLGFEGIDIWSAHAGCPHLDDVQKRLGGPGLRELLDRLKLRLNAFSVYAGGYPRYAELLGKSGGGVAITGSAAPCEPRDLTRRMRAFLEGLKPQLELAEAYGSSLAIENHGQSLLDSIDSIRAFVDLNRNPRLGIALAPFHIQARGESVPAAIRTAGPSLLFFYAWQHDPLMTLEQLPGHGPADFTPWIASLADVSYSGYVNPFLHSEPPPDRTEAALARSRDYLKTCYRNALTPA